jgi:lambda family phage tail tape measure protein
MSQVIGQGVIEVAVDGKGVSAGVGEIKRSIKSLGKDVGDSMSAGSARASKSIDNYIKKLQTAAATNGMSTRESELYTLALKGASKAQLEAADSALKMAEGYERGVRISQQIKTGFIAIASAAAAAGTAVTASIAAQVNAFDKFNDIKDATGASIENISALDRVARETGGNIEAVESILVKFNATLKESKPGDDADRLFKSLNLNIKELKGLDPAEALRRTAVAFAGFESDGNKARAMQELFGKSVKEAAPFLNDLAEKTSLVGTASTQTAAQAEIFNKQLFDLKANSTDAARSIVSDLLPAMNTFLQNFKEIRAQGNFGLIVKDAAKDVFGFGQLSSDASADIKNLMRTRDRLQKDLQFSARKGLGTRDIESDLADNARLLALSRARERNTIASQFAGQDFGDAVSRKTRLPSVGESSKEKTSKKDHSAAQEAKAQLAFDLDQIKTASAATLDTFSNNEKVFEAMRNAGLVDEREYFAQKIAFLTANEAAQVTALRAEKQRLEQESLSGKDKIDNDRKIADVEAKISKVRRAAAAETEVLATQQAAALRQVQASYLSATQAAQEYLDTMAKQQAREIADIGAGPTRRDFNQGVTQIEDRYASQRRDLQNNRAVLELEGKFTEQSRVEYDKRLSIIDEFQSKSLDQWKKHYADLKAAQGDWVNGLSLGLQTYFDETQNLSKQTSDAVGSTFKGMEDAIVEFARTGKLSVKSLVDSILTDIARIVIKQQITGPLAALLGGALKGGSGGNALSGDADYLKLIGLLGSSGLSTTGGSGGGWIADLFGSIFNGGRAIGGPVSAGGMYEINEKGSPEVLNAGGKSYLMMGGQGGTVSPGGAGGAPVSIVINNTVGDVATLSMLKEAQRGTEQRIIAGFGRSRSYGGSAS